MEKSKINRRALLIAGIYLVLGVVWIYYSDVFLSKLLLHRYNELTKFQIYKGWLFVTVTAFFIYLLTRHALLRQAEMIIRITESDNRYRQLYDLAPEMLASFNPETLELTQCNQTMSRVLGFSERELVGKKLLDLCHPDSHEAIKEALSSIHTTGGVRNLEVKFNIKDVTPVYVSLNISPVKGAGDTILYYTTMWRDISEQKKMEQVAAEDKLKIQHMLEANPTILVAMKVAHRHIIPYWMSDSITRIFGYSVEEALVPTWWPDHLYPEDRDRCVRGLKAILDKEYYSYEYRLQHKDGHYLYVHDELRVLRDDKGEPVEVICAWSDITLQQEERKKIQFYTAAFANTTEGVVITDLDGRILSVNHAFENISGYSQEELIGQNPRTLQSGRHDRSFYQNMWRRLKETGVWQGEIWNRRKSGEIYPQWLNITTIYDEQNQPSHYVGVNTDITQRKQAEYQLEHLAHYDALTDLPNRLLLQSRLEHAMQQAMRHMNRVGIVFIDLDDFKKVNDSLGHTAGDQLLKSVADRWLKRLRAEDTLGRLGGDEFLLLLENIRNVDEVGVVVRDLLKSLELPFVLEKGNEIYVEASIGISIFPDDGDDTDVLLQNADMAMYRSKDRGRNYISYFTEEMGTAANERLTLETNLRQALGRSQDLLLYYQPKVDIRTGEMTGLEALARWNRGGTEMISPMKFIPIAEKTGLISKLGEWVLSEACRQLRAWIDQGLKPVFTCVNVSVNQLRNENFNNTVTRILDEYSIDANLIGLEITESALMEHPEEFISIITKLKDAGLQIALDDFGTGFSNLSYLTRYPIDVLKIDSSFIYAIGTDNNALKLIDSIIDLAENFNMRTVAEGVETKEQLDYLAKAGCDEVQGYYFSKPLSAEKIEAQLRADITCYAGIR